MGKDVLGEFEHQVLLAALRLEGGAYSASIVLELERVTGREVAPAAVYIALRRLEEGGFARSELRPPDQGGRERRYFRITPRGLDLMRESRRRYVALWNGVEERLDGGRA
jgi:PadR family transcriptional regulator, regulatory protein PadR